MRYRKGVLFASFLCISINFRFGNSELLAIDCETDGVYDVNTTSGRAYRDNVESLLQILASNGSQANGFHNYTVENAEASAKGLFLCRGDITASDCVACLDDASPKILEICPNQTGAVIFYDKCILRFSNQSIFSRLDTGYKLYYWINENVSDTTLLNQALGDAFDQITTRAARDNVSGRKFAVQDAKFTNFEKIYAMGQCTPDLSDLDCELCLTTAIRLLPSCCTSRSGGRVLFASCNIRYDPAPFYRTLAPPPQPQPKTNPPPPPTQPPSPGEPGRAKSQNGWRMSTPTIVLVGFLAFFTIALLMALLCSIRKSRMRRALNIVEETSGVSSNISSDYEPLRYSFIQVQHATNNFETSIGQGGFGLVYKGTLPGEKVVAVKRLSITSTQGEQEFTNEIKLLAKVRHRNLVGLLGYCLEGEEKILIYEYFVNKSLDHFLFVSVDRPIKPPLNWVMRHRIIKGIARGLFYLHVDCGVNIIIHRDLKAGNVLLDQNMDAKISDFGMARLFDIDQSQNNTSTIAGTLGYMAPEYIQRGNLSVKLDVFSFGVLILEIISGKKIHEGFGNDNLPTYAWKQWRDKTFLALMDPEIEEAHDINEVSRCIQIGLLCVVEDVRQRPDMAQVTQMLDSDSMPLSDPDQPAYYNRSRTGTLQREVTPATQISSLHIEASINNVTVTELYPR